MSTYQDLRRLLHDELGLEPSAALAGLHSAILGHQPQLDWSPPPPVSDQAPAAAPRPPAATPARGPAPTRYAKTDGVNIAYQVTSQGPVDVVLVPGFVSNIDLYWDNPAPGCPIRCTGCRRSTSGSRTYWP